MLLNKISACVAICNYKTTHPHVWLLKADVKQKLSDSTWMQHYENLMWAGLPALILSSLLKLTFKSSFHQGDGGERCVCTVKKGNSVIKVVFVFNPVHILILYLISLAYWIYAVKRYILSHLPQLIWLVSCQHSITISICVSLLKLHILYKENT